MSGLVDITRKLSSGENFPLLLARHQLGQRLTIPGVPGGRRKVALRDFLLRINAANDAGFSATRGP